MDREQPAVLGGSLSPLGQSIGFLEAPLELVAERLRAWRAGLGTPMRVRPARAAWPGCLLTLNPLEKPWSRELVAAHGAWTAYVNNDLGGGDPGPPTCHLANTIGVRWVIASHHPMNAAGHASTQLWLGGPEGDPPLRYVRTVAAYAEDHHWSWETTGRVQDFERPDLYRARTVRDRLTRPLLVEYLAALGIDADDHHRYARAVSLTRRITWPWQRRRRPGAR